ncbi:MAG TPA: TolC family protein [Gemmatimonadaceae bacterium]|nr:TolC family protein [Gemmatimonadaceae bacterium]
MTRRAWSMLLFAAGSLVVPATGQGQDTGSVPVVSLPEARRRAQAVDADAVAARGQVSTTAWEQRVARIDLLTPRLSGDVNYTHFSDPFFNFGTGNISPNAASATLQASYTVLGAGKLAELRRARAALASAEASETAVRFGTALETDAAYFAVLADRELARVAADRLRRAEEQFGVARVRVLAGEAIAPDSLQLLLEVSRARFVVLQRDSALTTSRLRLGRRVGLAGAADAAPIDTTAPPPLPLSRSDAITELRARGPTLEAARAAERSASAVLAAEREGYLPDVTVGATTGAYDQELFPSALRRSQFAVTLSLPIWNGGQRELAVARAGAARTVARARREEEERAAGEVMAAAYDGYETARAGITLATVAVAAAAENYRVQRARYREGATTILDLIEAQLALSEAEASVIQARYTTRLRLAQIEALLGRRIHDGSDTDPTDR